MVLGFRLVETRNSILLDFRSGRWFHSAFGHAATSHGFFLRIHDARVRRGCGERVETRRHPARNKFPSTANYDLFS